MVFRVSPAGYSLDTYDHTFLVLRLSLIVLSIVRWISIVYALYFRTPFFGEVLAHEVPATPPIALFSERYNTRTWPLISGQIILIGSQIMLMEAPTYWVMVLARIIQGFSSSIIWIVGLALL